MNVKQIEFKLLIEEATLNTKIDLEQRGHCLKWVCFSQYNGNYEWIAERSWKNSQSSGYVYPLKNSLDVKTFKTLKEAKRNFIKRWIKGEPNPQS